MFRHMIGAEPGAKRSGATESDVECHKQAESMWTAVECYSTWTRSLHSTSLPVLLCCDPVLNHYTRFHPASVCTNSSLAARRSCVSVACQSNRSTVMCRASMRMMLNAFDSPRPRVEAAVPAWTTRAEWPFILYRSALCVV